MPFHLQTLTNPVGSTNGLQAVVRTGRVVARHPETSGAFGRQRQSVLMLEVVYVYEEPLGAETVYAALVRLDFRRGDFCRLTFYFYSFTRHETK